MHPKREISCKMKQLRMETKETASWGR
jgi:hypothetical protein